MQIVETVKDYEISFPYDERKVKAVKNISGAWYQKNNHVWHIPRHRQREIESLRKTFNVVDQRQRDTYLMPEMIGEIEPLPDLDIPLALYKKPYPYQEKGIAYCRRNKMVIIGDKPGLGKTIQAIGTICSYGMNENRYLNAGPGLVICPSSLKINWQTEWKEVAGHRAMILSDSIKRSWVQFYKVGMCDVFITNYESLKKFFVQPGWSKPKEGRFRMVDIPFNESINIFKWIIVDESHRCKDISTQQAKFVMGIARGKEIVLELTGTPVLNKTKDLLSQLYVINKLRDVVSHLPQPVNDRGVPCDSSGYQRFINRYCGGGNESTNVKELNYRLNKYCFFSREKSEVLKDLPEKLRQVIRCDITNRAEYDIAKDKFADYLRSVKGFSSAEIKKSLKGEIMVKMGILKQLSARGKMEAAKEYIDEIVDNGQKVVVFVHHHVIADGLKEMYPEAVMVTGRQTSEEKNRAVHDFQKCKRCGVRLEDHKDKDHDHEPSGTNIIICSSSGGEGLTLTAASETLMIEFPWTWGRCEQYEDRTHRISQTNNVRIGYLLGHKTIDEYCYFDIILKKKNLSEEVTGVEDSAVEEMIDDLLTLFNQK